MPGVLPSSDSQFAAQLAQSQQLLRGLLTQQQTTISNLEGQPVINVGLIPGSSPARYGLSFVNPATGAEIMFLGVDAAGVPALHVYDTQGNERVVVGELPNADYGLQVTDTLGNSEEILPAVEQFVAADINVTSTSYVSDGGPSVTAVVGASGKVKVEASSFVSSNAASNGAWVGLFIDGTLNLDLTEVDSAGGQITTSFAFNGIVTGLSSGSHTFELRYKQSVGGSSADFSRRSLTVTPL